jgi:hypothetical protein
VNSIEARPQAPLRRLTPALRCVEMSVRTIQLDEDTEMVLRQIRKATGLPVSEAVKRGLQSLRANLAERGTQAPYDVYRQLDIGPGGYAVAPSTETRRGVREAIRKKLLR